MTFSRAYQLKLIRIEKGICRDCGKGPPTATTLTCEACKESRRAQQDRRQIRKKAECVCHSCSGPSRPGKNLCQSCSDKNVAGIRIRRRETKLLIQEHFGGKCGECAETDFRCLVLHHVNKDGKEECKGTSTPRMITPLWYARLRVHIEAGKTRTDLKLLCHNCHAKHHTPLFDEADND